MSESNFSIPSVDDYTLADYWYRIELPKPDPTDSVELLQHKIGQVLQRYFTYYERHTPPNSHTWDELAQELVNRITYTGNPYFETYSNILVTLSDLSSDSTANLLIMATKILTSWQ